MRYHISLLVLFPFLITAQGCAQPEGSEYFPMSDDSRWEYTLEYMTRPAGVQQASTVRRVDGQHRIDGESYYKFVTVVSGFPGTDPEIRYYRKTNEGIFVRWSEESDEYLETPFPLTVGNEWTVGFSEGGEEGTLQLKYKLEAIETVVFAEHSYEDCLKISFVVEKEGHRVEVTSFYARGVGLVRQVTKLPRITMELRLEQYEI